MDPNELILISVDDHVVEPPNVFEGRLPKKYADQAPRLIRRADGTQAWAYEGLQIPNVGLNAVAGRPPEEYGMEPTTLEEIRKGTWDVHTRVKDQSANGVLASLNFPSFPRFTGQIFAENRSDPGQALAMVQAYNDWHIDEWCGSYPDRFIPLAIPAYWDIDVMVSEVERVAAKGGHAMTWSANPFDLGFPSHHSDHWDPFWAACQDHEMVVCIHLGSNSKLEFTSPDAPMTVHITGSGISLYNCASDLLWSPLFKKFPNLRIALSEGGIGWIPYFLERADYVYRHHKAWTGSDFGGRLPSEVFKEHIVTCFIDDEVGVELRHRLNPDMITWECDYPHSDSTWPDAPETVARYLQDVPPDEVAKITHRNAMRLFHFDPYSIRPAERCTAGALRAEVAGHDVSIRSKGLKTHVTTGVGAFGVGHADIKTAS
jgi:predicted TIM-barrel fold metal-dependent hydrolase